MMAVHSMCIESTSLVPRLHLFHSSVWEPNQQSTEYVLDGSLVPRPPGPENKTNWMVTPARSVGFTEVYISVSQFTCF